MTVRRRLDKAARLHDAALLAVRLYLGGFLVWGVWDNITSAAQMAEFEAFLAGLNMPLPALAAPVSVWVQFACGVLLIPGLLTRWAGLFVALNFAVAVVLLGLAGGDTRTLYDPAITGLVGLLLMTGGPGRFALDALIARRR